MRQIPGIQCPHAAKQVVKPLLIVSCAFRLEPDKRPGNNRFGSVQHMDFQFDMRLRPQIGWQRRKVRRAYRCGQIFKLAVRQRHPRLLAQFTSG